MRVSIGIPFYNNKQTLADAIRSVFAQTFRDWELILVDDGSSDRSLRIAHAVKDSRVRVVSGGTNKGLAFRLNQITQLARGEYIARMDGDDLMHPERLARQLQFLDANPEVDLVDSAIYTIDASNNPLGLRGLSPIDIRPAAVLKGGAMIHPAVMGRATWFRSNPYDAFFRRAEDRELWCRACRKSVFERVREPLYFLREGRSVSLRKYLDSSRESRMIFLAFGPSIAGWHVTAPLIIKSYVKDAVYRLFTGLGVQHMLVARRNIPPSELQRETAVNTINTIMLTPVPGLDEMNVKG